MGNCAGEGRPRPGGELFDGLCSGRRRTPAFLPPVSRQITYSFDHQADRVLGLYGEERPVAEEGFLVEASKGNGCVPRWWTVKEYASGAAPLRVCIAGRLLVHCPAVTETHHSTAPLSVFQFCTRGCPVYSSVRTQSFRHVAQVATSGIFYSIFMLALPTGLFLCPKISLVLESGDEVVLVEDRLGPVRAPQSFLCDFAAVDENGRDVQMDVIFRGYPSEPRAEAEAEGRSRTSSRGSHRWTLRTCLHDYAALNSQVAPASVVMGYSGLADALPGASVHLQHFVMSEDLLPSSDPRGPAATRPFDLWREAPTSILFEGKDARLSSMALVVPEAPVQHPQLQSSGPTEQRCVSASGACTAPNGEAQDSPDIASVSGAAGEKGSSSADAFWHHFRYGELSASSRRGGTRGHSSLRGEFWLSRREVDRKNVYFYCSSTLGQALTMCIIFRFRCPPAYLERIQANANVLQEVHLPSNGLILGIEQDPRNAQLMRMFAEHRNEILEDMVVCFCQPADLSKCVVHQEVYDNGTAIVYRLTLLHSDGARQIAVLQQSCEQLEDGSSEAKGSGAYHMEEEPSARFPIVPCSAKHELAQSSHVLVYTASAFSPQRRRSHDDAQDADNDPAAEEIGTASLFNSCEASMVDNNSVPSDVEDWQSAGGGCSDGEGGHAEYHHRSSSSLALQRAQALGATWRRPLIDSAVLLGNVEQPPFACRSVRGGGAA